MSLLVPHQFPPSLPKLTSKSLLNKPTPLLHFPNPTKKFPSFSSELKTLIPSSSSSFTFDFADDTNDVIIDGDDFYEDSPWEGAVIYKCNASVSYVEYCTTLERLGMGEYSTRVSRARASVMGMRLPVTRGKEKGDEGTPVMVSVDVARRTRRLKLDEIVRTVLTLACNRCSLEIFVKFVGVSKMVCLYDLKLD